MPNEMPLERKPPRFYKKPSSEDIESKGQVMANIHARIRARIVGSRVLSTTVTIVTGSAITAQEFLNNDSVEPTDLIANFCIPAIINGLAQIKVENQLRHTEHDLSELLPDILKPTDTSGDLPRPLDET